MTDPSARDKPQRGCVLRMFKFVMVLVILAAGAVSAWYVYRVVVEKDKGLQDRGVFEFAKEKAKMIKDMTPEKFAQVKKMVEETRRRLLAKKAAREKRRRELAAAERKNTPVPRPTPRSDAEKKISPPVKEPAQKPDIKEEPVPEPKEPAPTPVVEKKPEDPVPPPPVPEPVAPVPEPVAPEPLDAEEPVRESEPVPGVDSAIVEDSIDPVEEKHLDALMVIEQSDKLVEEASENDWDYATLCKAEKGYRRAFAMLDEMWKQNPDDASLENTLVYIQRRLHDINKQKRIG